MARVRGKFSWRDATASAIIASRGSCGTRVAGVRGEANRYLQLLTRIMQVEDAVEITKSTDRKLIHGQ